MTILDTYTTSGIGSAIVVCALAIFVSIVLGVIMWIIEDDLFMGILTGGLCLLGTFLLLFLSGYLKPHTRYEVTIDDSVPFVEIYEKYDVIDHHGDIYVLEEKDDNN